MQRGLDVAGVMQKHENPCTHSSHALIDFSTDLLLEHLFKVFYLIVHVVSGERFVGP